MPVVSDVFVYKKIGSLELEFNVYWREHSKGSPVFLYFHGNGSPVQGSRWNIPQHMLTGVRKWKYALISADVRLAPQAGIQDIFKDVEDCIRFIRDPRRLAAKLPAGTIDPIRLAVAGSGGGGYLALLAGLHVVPKPQAVLALHPITDPLGSFFTTSHPWDETDADGLDKETAESLLAPCLDPNGEVLAYHIETGDAEFPRHLLYKHALHHGNLAELLRFDFTTNAQLDPANDKWRVAKQIANCGMPPTFIMHGEADKQVDVGQSDKVVGALRGVVGPDLFPLYNQYQRPYGLAHAFDDNEEDSEEESDVDSGNDGEVDSWHSSEEGGEDDSKDDGKDDGKDDSKDDSKDDDNGGRQTEISPIELCTNAMYNFMHCFV